MMMSVWMFIDWFFRLQISGPVRVCVNVVEMLRVVQIPSKMQQQQQK